MLVTFILSNNVTVSSGSFVFSDPDVQEATDGLNNTKMLHPCASNDRRFSAGIRGKRER